MHSPPRPALPRPRPPGPPDADLLARWAAGRDEAAFELLVRRHGPLVLGVCRRVLADAHDADDAFQATFLVLARKAATVGRGEALPAWLHRVACRAALRIRGGRAKPAATLPDDVPAPPDPDPAWAELARVLDEEVAKLPRRHRAVVVLCCLEGRTGDEAARLLGCPPGTVSSRLTRARDRLRDRLARRGFAPAVAAAFAVPAALTAAPPYPLLAATLAAAADFAAGLPFPGPPPRPAAVAEGVLRAMAFPKLRLASALLAAGLLAAGAVVAGQQPAAEPGQPPARTSPKANPIGKAADAPPVVKLVRPEPGGLDRVAVLVGLAEAARRADLFPGVPGVVKSVAVPVGDRVKAGQVLAEIDAPDLELEAKRAATGVAQAEGLLKEAEAAAGTAKAEAGAANAAIARRQKEAEAAKATLALRKRQFDLVKEAAKRGVADATTVAEAEVNYLTASAAADAADAAIEAARAELEVKKGKLAQAEAAVATARANVEAARVGLEKARLALARTRIVAPFEGVVIRQWYDVGEAVRAGDSAAPAFTLIRADRIRVVVEVPERVAASVKAGMPAEVAFDSVPGVKVAGGVSRVGFEVDPAKATVRVEIELPNPKGEVRPGASGRVTLTLGKGPKDALRIPASALVARRSRPTPAESGSEAVYVYRDGKARLTDVRIGYEGDGWVEVVEGLTADDRVVADPKGLSGPEAEVRVEPGK